MPTSPTSLSMGRPASMPRKSAPNYSHSSTYNSSANSAWMAWLSRVSRCCPGVGPSFCVVGRPPLETHPPPGQTVQSADLRGTGPRFSLAHSPCHATARRDRHLQPVALRGRSRRPRSRPGAEKDLERTVQTDQSLRAYPGTEWHGDPEVLPAH